MLYIQNKNMKRTNKQTEKHTKKKTLQNMVSEQLVNLKLGDENVKGELINMI